MPPEHLNVLYELLAYCLKYIYIKFRLVLNVLLSNYFYSFNKLYIQNYRGLVTKFVCANEVGMCTWLFMYQRIFLYYINYYIRI